MINNKPTLRLGYLVSMSQDTGWRTALAVRYVIDLCRVNGIIPFMARLIHYDKLGTARFITFSCFRHLRLFREQTSFELFLQSLNRIRDKYRFNLLGYVIMPDHVHLLIYPEEEIAVGRVIGELKAHSAFHILQAWKTHHGESLDKLKVIRNRRPVYAFWQRRCYDHNCRTIDIVREKIDYCHNNPVKAGLVSNPVEWFWSSYRWYAGNRDGPIEIDDIPLL